MNQSTIYHFCIQLRNSYRFGQFKTKKLFLVILITSERYVMLADIDMNRLSAELICINFSLVTKLSLQNTGKSKISSNYSIQVLTECLEMLWNSLFQKLKCPILYSYLVQYKSISVRKLHSAVYLFNNSNTGKIFFLVLFQVRSQHLSNAAEGKKLRQDSQHRE